MRAHRRHDPIAVPLGHTEQSPYDWSRLNTPAIVRRPAQPRAPRWEDVPDAIRDEVRSAAVEQLQFKLQAARRVLAQNPGLENVDAIVHLEAALAAARRLP